MKFELFVSLVTLSVTGIAAPAGSVQQQSPGEHGVLRRAPQDDFVSPDNVVSGFALRRGAKLNLQFKLINEAT